MSGLFKTVGNLLQIFATEDESDATDIVAQSDTGDLPEYTQFIQLHKEAEVKSVLQYPATTAEPQRQQPQEDEGSDEEDTEEDENGYICEVDQIIAPDQLPSRQCDIFLKLTVMDVFDYFHGRQTTIENHNAMRGAIELFNEIKTELTEMYTSRDALHLSLSEMPLILLARPREWQADYIYRELVTIEKVFSIGEMKQLGNDPIIITLKEVIEEIDKKKNLPHYYNKRNVNNMYYKSEQKSNNRRSISGATIINSLEITVEHFFCNYPGSISFNCTESSTGPRKAISMNSRRGMCIFELDRTKLFSKLENERLFDAQPMWYRYLPKSCKDLEKYKTEITNKDGTKRVRIEKNHITMTLMGHMEAFIKQHLLTQEPIKFNGDIYYYYFKPENWAKMEELIDDITSPMHVETVNIQLSPYGHSTWEEMLNDNNLVNTIRSAQRPQQQQQPIEGHHQVIDLSNFATQVQMSKLSNHKVEHRNKLRGNVPMDRFEESYEFLLTLEVSYKIN